jgi:hypothetical protein
MSTEMVLLSSTASDFCTKARGLLNDWLLGVKTTLLYVSTSAQAVVGQPGGSHFSFRLTAEEGGLSRVADLYP